MKIILQFIVFVTSAFLCLSLVVKIQKLGNEQPAISDSDTAPQHQPQPLRPTPEQLVNEYYIWELRDLQKQATSPADKQLIEEALEIKRKKLSHYELSSDFETNMIKAIK